MKRRTNKNKINMKPYEIHCISNMASLETLKCCDSNRDIDMNYVQKIMPIFKANYMIQPIIINEKAEIIDGQHRWAFCKLTGYPLYYIVVPGLTDDDCKKYNTNHATWKKEDYLQALSMQGSESAQRFMTLIETLQNETKMDSEDETKMHSKDIITLISKVLNVSPTLFSEKKNYIYPKTVKGKEWDWSKDTTFTSEMYDKCYNNITTACKQYEEIIRDYGGAKYISKMIVLQAFLYFHDVSDVHTNIIAEAVKAKRQVLCKRNKKDVANLVSDLCTLHNKSIYKSKNKQLKREYLTFNNKTKEVEYTADTNALFSRGML